MRSQGRPAEATSRVFELLQIGEFRRRGLTGSGVAVGHLDTGLDDKHPALRHQPAAFRHFDRQGFATNSMEVFDSAVHGTRTASILGGRSIDGWDVGIAPDCRLHCGVVLEHGDVLARIVFGMAWLLRCNVRILCLPFGIPGPTPVLASMTRLLRRKGVLVIAPVGNSGVGRCLSPGDYQDALSVGAGYPNSAALAFSGSCDPSVPWARLKPDLLAPGVDIPTAEPGGGYRLSSGTSMACAIVAGCAALLMEAAPTAPPTVIESALLSAANPVQPGCVHRSRRGLVQPLEALGRMRRLTAHRNAPSFGASTAPLATDPPRYVDPRLVHQCRFARDQTVIEAMFVVSEDAPVHDDDPRGAAGQLVDRVAGAHREPIHGSRFIAEANLAVVRAKAPIIRDLMQDSTVTIANATDVDRALWT